MSNNVMHTNDSDAKAAALQAELEQVNQRMAELREQAAREQAEAEERRRARAAANRALKERLDQERRQMEELQRTLASPPPTAVQSAAASPERSAAAIRAGIPTAPTAPTAGTAPTAPTEPILVREQTPTIESRPPRHVSFLATPERSTRRAITQAGALVPASAGPTTPTSAVLSALSAVRTPPSTSAVPTTPSRAEYKETSAIAAAERHEKDIIEQAHLMGRWQMLRDEVVIEIGRSYNCDLARMTPEVDALEAKLFTVAQKSPWKQSDVRKKRGLTAAEREASGLAARYRQDQGALATIGAAATARNAADFFQQQLEQEEEEEDIEEEEEYPRGRGKKPRRRQ
ncbi:uncharacterized protein EV422DRAFT_565882 [Fimicolochytrium jonesii]|uniref:uncharacterized protein n=1 Tax=Fimicolochytrium jonesii TaxID=1396493 RepID=UPI0022FDD8A6|nr:uncharacterized protein EV422DRAFT_565882 [Fimicolochytrium jonesii]KAI8823018.1 hypothetical protein EV422DRAFT_565882 [Fimicolochytrium jonesii]